MTEITVLAASGRIGARLVRALAARGLGVRAVGRDPKRMAEACQSLQSTGLDPAKIDRRVADLEDPAALAPALAGAEVVINCAPARFAGDVLRALPPTATRFVALGSTRKFTRFPDQAALEVQAAERLLAQAGVDQVCVMVHPTMIYGGGAERNVARVMEYVRRFPLAPLPLGGRMLVQPIHVDDVVAALAAAALRPGLASRAIVIAGAKAITLAELFEACARASGKRIWIVPAPLRLLLFAGGLAEKLKVKLPVSRAEILRFTEDKSFPIDDMVAELGVQPVSFEVGLGKVLAEV